jgi:hypothetical protein
MKFMKSLIKTTLVAVALLLAVTTNAQDDKPVTFGVKAGMNLSNVSGGGFKSKIGFRGGVSLDFALAEDWYLLTGLNYSVQGAKTADVVNLSMSYLQLPVHAGYKIAVSDNTKLVFHAGPYVGYAIHSKWKMGNSSGLNPLAGLFDTDDWADLIKDVAGATMPKMKKFDFGLGLGVGAEFGKFGVDLGWDFGLVNIVDAGVGSGKNMNAYLTVGYKF